MAGVIKITKRSNRQRNSIQSEIKALSGYMEILENGIMALGARFTLGKYAPCFFIFSEKRYQPYYFSLTQLRDLIKAIPSVKENIDSYDPEGDDLAVPYSGSRYALVTSFGNWEKTVIISFVEILGGKFIVILYIYIIIGTCWINVRWSYIFFFI